MKRVVYASMLLNDDDEDDDVVEIVEDVPVKQEKQTSAEMSTEPEEDDPAELFDEGEDGGVESSRSSPMEVDEVEDVRQRPCR